MWVGFPPKFWGRMRVVSGDRRSTLTHDSLVSTPEVVGVGGARLWKVEEGLAKMGGKMGRSSIFFVMVGGGMGRGHRHLQIVQVSPPRVGWVSPCAKNTRGTPVR